MKTANDLKEELLQLKQTIAKLADESAELREQLHTLQLKLELAKRKPLAWLRPDE